MTSEQRDIWVDCYSSCAHNLTTSFAFLFLEITGFVPPIGRTFLPVWLVLLLWIFHDASIGRLLQLLPPGQFLLFDSLLSLHLHLLQLLQGDGFEWEQLWLTQNHGWDIFHGQLPCGCCEKNNNNNSKMNSYIWSTNLGINAEMMKKKDLAGLCLYFI